MTRETFQQQSKLPSLPVPPLKQTIDKYLDSAKVFLSPEELRETEQIARNFEQNEGVRLQSALVKKSTQERNWVEQWWDDVYLDGRYPLIPWSNFAGINPRALSKTGELSQLHWTADMIHHSMRYWLALRRETLEVQKNRGAALDMNQVYRMFNATRLPGRKKDTLKHYFRTDQEGHTPSHVIILCRGHYYLLETLDRTGQIYSPEQLMQSLKVIKHRSLAQRNVHHIASLTTMNRDEWAEMRERLISLTRDNARFVELIESSVMIISLTDENITDECQLMRYSLLGDPRVQWADKSINMHVHLDGQGTCNCDGDPYHSNIDAIALLKFMDTAAQGAVAESDHWLRPTTTTDFPDAVELVFAVDQVITAAIRRAEDAFYRTCDDVDVRVVHYKHMGNNDFRKAKVYGDTLIQLAMQLAYFRLHNRPAPTYETASTRKYYHGRTGTVRSCTQEAVDFAKTVLNPKSSMADKQAACKRAYDKHNRLMAEASDGQGIDRHLLGLRKTAEEFSKGCSPKVPEPAIFRDSAWKKSGGDGNFSLSTSFLAYDSEGSFGFVVAMCNDGYGTFYKINDSSISFTCTAYKSSKETRLAEWVDSLNWSLDRVAQIFALGNHSKL